MATGNFSEQLLKEYKRAKERAERGHYIFPAVSTKGIEYSARTVMDFFPSQLRVGISTADITIKKAKG